MTRIGFVWSDGPEVAVRAEALGVDSLWVGGHLLFRSRVSEPVARLARLAALTTTVQIGTSVAILPLYPPVLVAKQVADIDVASGGRVVFGVGVGGDHPPEFAASGVPLAGRGARTDEAITVIRRLWTGEPVHHRGPLGELDGARLEPPPRQPGGPPIVVAGRKGAAVRRAALLGDGWMPYLYSPERYARSVDEVRGIAAGAGRDLGHFAWMAFIFVHVGHDQRRAVERAGAELSRRYGRDVRGFVDRLAVAGDADHVAERLAAFSAAGAEHLVIAPLMDGGGTLEAVMADVAPQLGRVATGAVPGFRVPGAGVSGTGVPGS